MGLALVELVLAVEEHFGVEIPDDPPEQARTIGDFAALIVTLTHEPPPGLASCRTSRAFYHLRRGLVRAVGLEPGEIRPATPIAQLVPGPVRKQLRQRLMEEGISLPRFHWDSNTTVGELAEALAVDRDIGGPLRYEGEPLSYEEVEAVLFRLTHEYLDAPLDQLSSESVFVELDR